MNNGTRTVLTATAPWGERYRLPVERVLWEARTYGEGLPTPWEVETEIVADSIEMALMVRGTMGYNAPERVVAEIMARQWVDSFGTVGMGGDND